MKFTAVATLFALPLLAVAMPGGNPPSTPTVTTSATPSSTPVSQCNTGPIQCCNSVESARSSPASLLLGLLGIVLQDLNVLVGLSCSPLSVIGIGGNSWYVFERVCSSASSHAADTYFDPSLITSSAQPVCCQDNSFSESI